MSGGPRRSAPQQIDTVIVGAGHAGLAMSRCLAGRSIDHVILERGEVANAWRDERWDSLRLLTPNWQTRLPGFAYDGDDPDGFMASSDVVAFIEAYARSFDAPVRTGTAVISVRPLEGGYRVITDRGEWRCRALVLASGACNRPAVPELAARLPSDVDSLSTMSYRRPGQLAPGGVLVVGASASGLQIADEVHRSGRPVTLAVGEHIRLPRRYRGRDIQWWLDALGVLDQRYDEVDDIVRARRVPSPQLVGCRSRDMLDLNALTHEGVRIVGRLGRVDGARAQFSGALRNHCQMADLKLRRLLRQIDEWVTGRDLGGSVAPARRPGPTRVPAAPLLELRLGRRGGAEIGTVIWATGYRPDYSWLQVPVLDRRGRLRHDGGVVAAPGLYAMGLNFMRRRKSSFIHGAGDDARDLAGHLAHYLARTASSRVVRGAARSLPAA